MAGAEFVEYEVIVVLHILGMAEGIAELEKGATFGPVEGTRTDYQVDQDSQHLTASQAISPFDLVELGFDEQLSSVTGQ